MDLTGHLAGSVAPALNARYTGTGSSFVDAVLIAPLALTDVLINLMAVAGADIGSTMDY